MLVRWFCGELLVWQKFHKPFVMKIEKFWWMKVRFTSVGDEFWIPVFHIQKSTSAGGISDFFRVCSGSAQWEIFSITSTHTENKSTFLALKIS
jgi:hypothetical protein